MQIVVKLLDHRGPSICFILLSLSLQKQLRLNYSEPYPNLPMCLCHILLLLHLPSLCFRLFCLQILPVPELMPFRLTGQFRNLLLPLTDLGPYRIPMTDVMRALRSESDLLLNTMDVFVQEPLIDWQVM